MHGLHEDFQRWSDLPAAVSGSVSAVCERSIDRPGQLSAVMSRPVQAMCQNECWWGNVRAALPGPVHDLREDADRRSDLPAIMSGPLQALQTHAQRAAMRPVMP